MQKLSDVMPEQYKATEGSVKQRPIESDDSYAAETENVPDTPDCPYCGKKMIKAGWLNGDGTIFWYPNEPYCRCEGFKKHAAEMEERKAAESRRLKAEAQQMVLQEKIKELIGKSGMNARFLRRTFETFQRTNENAEAYDTCKNYADHFREMLPDDDYSVDKNGLIICGNYGVGKTHLAAAMANQIMSTGTGVICMTMIDMLNRIKEEFSKRTDGDEAGVLNIYKKVPLLIIDDMGKEPPTEWAESTIFNIINARYEAMLPIVITTNYRPNELASRLVPKGMHDDRTAPAIVDRLHETCKVVVIRGTTRR